MCCSSCSSAASPAQSYAAVLAKPQKNIAEAKPVLAVESSANAAKAPGTGIHVDKAA